MGTKSPEVGHEPLLQEPSSSSSSPRMSAFDERTFSTRNNAPATSSPELKIIKSKKSFEVYVEEEEDQTLLLTERVSPMFGK